MSNQPKRPETGTMRFGSDWTGIFVRGDNAFYYAGALNLLLAAGGQDAPEALFAKSALRELADLLTSSMHGGSEPAAQVMKEFGECIDEKVP